LTAFFLRSFLSTCHRTLVESTYYPKSIPQNRDLHAWRNLLFTHSA
jgi:hypothetical protein